MLLKEYGQLYIDCDYFAKKIVGGQFVEAIDSVAANLSEGFGRYFYKENKQFCYYSRGSIFETKDWITKLKDRKIITEERFLDLDDKLNTIGKMLNGYIKAIGKANTEEK